MRRLCWVLIVFCFPAFAQEVFFKNQEFLDDIPPAHFYLHGQGDNFDINKDYITKKQEYNSSYRLPSAVIKKTGRNYHQNTAIGFTDENASLVIPDTVTRDIVVEGKGFTFSGWFYAGNLNEDKAIAYIGSDDSAKMDILLKDRKIIVRKRSSLDKKNVMVPVIETAFPLEYDGIIPVPNDITNGYFYLALASDKNSTRVYLSRPGGRLFSQWFYFGLMDELSVLDKIYFGRSPQLDKKFKLMDAYSNIMVYKRSLAPNEALNAFYLQSPLYPGVSYRFSNAQRELVPTRDDNQSGEFDEDGPFVWREIKSGVNGTLSSARWFIDSRMKGTGKFIPVNLRNARTGGYVYQKVGSDYYYQLLFPAENYAERTVFYMEKLEDDPESLYRKEAKGNIRFWSAHDSRYWLGNNDNYLYLDDSEKNGRWSITSAIKVYHGKDIELPAGGHRVMLRNLGDFTSKDKGARTYINIYSGASYYYAKLDRYSVSNSNISGVVNFTFRWLAPSDYGIYRKYIFRALNGYGLMQPYYGRTDKSENDYIITDENQGNFYWEVITIDTPKLDKKKVGDRSFHAIRASNGYGSFLLGRKDGYCPGGASICYVLKSGAGAYDNDGTPKKDFLWVIDYISGS